VNRAAREIRVSLRNRQRTIEDVKSLNRMRNVNELHLRNVFQNDAFHGSDEVVLSAKIGGQGDDRPTSHEILSATAMDFPEEVKLNAKVISSQGTQVIKAAGK
jgi:hypothetical protein